MVALAVQDSTAVKFYFVTVGPEGAPVEQSCVKSHWQISQSFCMVDIGPAYLL